jgi:hypothetical protein
MSHIIQKISNSEEIDLSLLTIRELEQLHFDEERYTADMIRKASPFSKERNVLMNKGYGLVNQIMHEKSLKQNKKIHAFGANKVYCQLVKKLIQNIKKQKKNNSYYFL